MTLEIEFAAEIFTAEKTTVSFSSVLANEQSVSILEQAPLFIVFANSRCSFCSFLLIYLHLLLTLLFLLVGCYFYNVIVTLLLCSSLLATRSHANSRALSNA